MSEKRYELDVRMDMPKLLIDNNTNEKYNLLMVNDIERFVDKLNEQQATISNLEKENENLKLKIVSLENEVQRQTNEIKNTRKEFIKKKEELNWLKSEDYLKKIY